jgi:hypothetical protein
VSKKAGQSAQDEGWLGLEPAPLDDICHLCNTDLTSAPEFNRVAAMYSALAMKDRLDATTATRLQYQQRLAEAAHLDKAALRRLTDGKWTASISLSVARRRLSVVESSSLFSGSSIMCPPD